MNHRLLHEKVTFWAGPLVSGGEPEAPVHDCVIDRVWSDTCVNITTPEGRSLTSVPIVYPGSPVPAGYYATMQIRELTFGEKAVGLNFNPGGHPLVDAIKRQFADTIDTLDQARQLTQNPEVKRQLSVAITEAQTAQMWAVKAVTWSH